MEEGVAEEGAQSGPGDAEGEGSGEVERDGLAGYGKAAAEAEDERSEEGVDEPVNRIEDDPTPGWRVALEEVLHVGVEGGEEGGDGPGGEDEERTVGRGGHLGRIARVGGEVQYGPLAAWARPFAAEICLR